MRVGWYLHHHGSGHLHRFLAAHAELDQVTAFSSLLRPAHFHGDWVDLPLDIGGDPPRAQTAGGVMHWAPLGHPGLQARMASIAGWIARTQPDAFIVDVSVEVALLVRLHGVPVIWLAQRGRRTDLPHTLAYQAADAIVAPWTEAVPAAAGAFPVGTHPRLIGALSRFDGRPPRPVPGSQRVLVLFGRGGHSVTPGQIAAAAAATPKWHWEVAGLPEATTIPGVNVHNAGADIWELLGAADVVVAGAGTNAISEVAAARRPLIAIPEPRPFDEQVANAFVLTAAGLADAHARWPDAAAWPAALESAKHRDPNRWSLLHDGAAAGRLAGIVQEVACGSA